MYPKLINVAWVLAATPFASHADNLLDVYRQARLNDPTLSHADSLRLSASESAVQARAPLRPFVSAEMNLTQTGAHGTAGSVLTYPRTPVRSDRDGESPTSRQEGYKRTRKIGVTLGVRIMNIGKHTELKAARSSAQAQTATHDAAFQQMLVRAATAYFRVLMADDARIFAKTNEQTLARHLDRAQVRFDVGLSTITDLKDVERQHHMALATALSAENTFSDSLEALIQITGRPVDNLKKLREAIPTDTPVLNEAATWVSQAVRNNPAVLASQYKVDAAEHTIASVRASHLPTIDATARYGKSMSWMKNGRASASLATARDTGHWRATAGLVLIVPIFAGGATQSRLSQAIQQRDAAQDTLETTRREVVHDTLHHHRSVLTGVGKTRAAKAAVESSELARDATQAGFEVGTRTIVDVLVAQQNMMEAQHRYSQARHQFVLDRLLLKQVTGKASVEDLDKINSLLL